MNTDNVQRNGEVDKAEIQISLVLQAFPEGRIGAWPNERELDYLYEREVILVRDAYLTQVESLVGGELREGLIDGVSVWSIPRQEPEQREQEARADDRDQEDPDEQPTEVTSALDLIDDRLGVGVATPNHVLSVCPGHMCPATEPEPVSQGAAPDPGICPGREGDGVFIYVIDTGLLDDADTHPWLAGVTGEPDVFAYPNIPPYTGHGTFVAGVARCMAPAAQVRVARVVHHAGAQLETEIIKHMDSALGDGPDIISLSAGASSRKDVPPLGFEALWQRYRHHKGVLLVAAAGNNSSRRPFWPAAFPQVVSVGALSSSWRSRAAFSDYGGWVDVYAPGEGLVNAYASGTFSYQEPRDQGVQRPFYGMARWSGTSFSTPMVSGLVAARMSRTGENSRLAARELLRMARAQALPGVGPALSPCDVGDADQCCCGCGCCGGRRESCGHRHCRCDHGRRRG
jgi:subtilisin family serine protease